MHKIIKNTSILLTLLLLPALLAQEELQEEDKRLKNIETQVVILKDYLKKRLLFLRKEAKNNSDQIERLHQQNAQLREKVAHLEEMQKELREELLRLKIEMTAMRKGESAVAKEVTVSPEQQDDSVKQEVPQFSDATVQQLAENLTSSKSPIRRGALLKLRRIDGDEATQAITMALDDRDVYVKILAAKILAQKRAEKAIPALISALLDKNRLVRREVNRALEEITGVSVGFDASASKEEIQQKIQLWREKVESTKSGNEE